MVSTVPSSSLWSLDCNHCELIRAGISNHFAIVFRKRAGITNSENQEKLIQGTFGEIRKSKNLQKIRKNKSLECCRKTRENELRVSYIISNMADGITFNGTVKNY